ncbi:MAG: monovalent cation/H+ antiporter subunit D family protein [Wenzhouxiangellaceae bacterium]|nr:monovalent cation/H+ antiporter subunit D family protein [Wenzhouxiangellaceae bacterium]MBS3746407.1 monovalent cation/H+ antiporter subunit D family protein [Wenzhouxiangellaceae bacterium]MBS3824065.1 monovalent cation/H+ antiporter subunit D family protein [Wenzhouxiangellaceae bacterium]
MLSTSWLPLLAIVAPIVGGMLVFRAASWERKAAGFQVVAVCSATTLSVCAFMAYQVSRGHQIELSLLELVPPIRLALRVDAMGALFAMTVASLFVLAQAHAIGYLSNDRRQWAFHGFLLASLGCMIGVALAANLVTLLLFYELFSLLAYPLIVHERTPKAFRAGLKYLIYILSGGALIFSGIVLAYWLAGSVDFLPGGVLPMTAPNSALQTIWCLLVAGFGVKAALMPLHGWVPDAHPAAPAPFSAVLSGVMVAAGVFAIVRVLLEIFGPAMLDQLGVLPWLAGFSGFAIVAAAMLAVAENDLKRRLAYSTISQMAYVSLAATLLHPVALTGALVHITHHAFFKGGLFLCAGSILAVTGLRRISRMRGLGWRMPWTAGTFTLLALAMTGLPPLSGFVGKWTLGTGMAQAGGFGHLAVMLLGSLLAAAYLWPVIYRIWQRPEQDDPLHAGASRDERHERRGWMLFAVLAAGAATVALGVAAGLPGFPLELARMAAEQLLGPSAWK